MTYVRDRASQSSPMSYDQSTRTYSTESLADLTKPRDAHPAPSASLVTQVIDCARELAELAGLACLLEAPSGRLIAHHLIDDDAPELLVSVLISGSLSSLHQVLAARRTIGLLASGPVVEGTLLGRPALFLALRDGGIDLGGAWLLGREQCTVSLADLQAPVQKLTWLLACTAESSDLTCLEGGALPKALANANHLWVARVIADVSAVSLRQALIAKIALVPVETVQCGQSVYVIAAGSPGITADRAFEALGQICNSAAARLGTPVTAGFSGAVRAGGLPTARAQADAAVSLAAKGTTTTLDAIRSILVVRRLAAGFGSMPDFGPDPLWALINYDTRRKTQFVLSLRAWLDAFGDVARAAASLGIHANTLRYRMTRIVDILGIDLNSDPHARVVVHLQLLANVAGQEPA